MGKLGEKKPVLDLHENRDKKNRMCVLCVRTFFSVVLRPTRATASSFLRFLDYTQRRTTVGRTPLDESSARHRDLTTHNIHNRQISMPPAGFEPKI